MAQVETELENYWRHPLHGGASANIQYDHEPEPILYGKDGKPIYAPGKRIGFVKS